MCKTPLDGLFLLKYTCMLSFHQFKDDALKQVGPVFMKC